MKEERTIWVIEMRILGKRGRWRLWYSAKGKRHAGKMAKHMNGICMWTKFRAWPYRATPGLFAPETREEK